MTIFWQRIVWKRKLAGLTGERALPSLSNGRAPFCLLGLECQDGRVSLAQVAGCLKHFELTKSRTLCLLWQRIAGKSPRGSSSGQTENSGGILILERRKLVLSPEQRASFSCRTLASRAFLDFDLTRSNFNGFERLKLKIKIKSQIKSTALIF